MFMDAPYTDHIPYPKQNLHSIYGKQWLIELAPIFLVLVQEVNDKSQDFSCFGAVTHGGESWMSMYQGAQRCYWGLYITQMRRPNLNWATGWFIEFLYGDSQQIVGRGGRDKKSVIRKMIAKPLLIWCFQIICKWQSPACNSGNLKQHESASLHVLYVWSNFQLEKIIFASWKLNPLHPVDAKDSDYVGFGQFGVEDILQKADPNGWCDGRAHATLDREGPQCLAN